jgi:hypothetical protein
MSLVFQHLLQDMLQLIPEYKTELNNIIKLWDPGQRVHHSTTLGLADLHLSRLTWNE